MKLNTIHNLDCLKGMRQMDSGSVDLVVTSPPYNIRNSTGGAFKTRTLGKNAFWNNSQLVNAGYDGYKDDIPYDDYVAWQRACLAEMMRLLAPAGAIFYNHKWRVQHGQLQDRAAIVNDLPVPVRQIIIWSRSGGLNFNPTYFLPTYEVIYLFARPGFKLAEGANKWGDVWRISQVSQADHPASYPVELAERCVLSVNPGLVLDPFMGSGTTAIAAEKHGRAWVGFEQSAKYVDAANERIALARSQQKIFK